jgi:hypothetical protein
MNYSDPDFLLPAHYTSKEEKRPDSYRGFGILRRRPYFLYEVEPKDGYDLPAALAGKFTHLALLQQTIDQFLISNPTASVDTAYFKRNEKPKRGRPKKHNEQKSTNL